MHKIRAAAHRGAWTYEQGDPPATRFSAFRSRPSRSSTRTRDVESGLKQSSMPTATSRQDFATDTDPVNFTLSPQQTETNLNRIDGSPPISPVSPGSPSKSPSTKPLNEKTTVEHYKSGSQASGNSLSAAPKLRKRDKVVAFFNKEFKREGKGNSNSDSESSKPKKTFTIWGQVKTVVFGSWVNVLLVCAPIGIALHYSNPNDTAGLDYASFVVNFIAIIPLAGILSFATEEIALRVGETLGGLLNASFGNAVELIVSIIALSKDQIIIVQTSLIGSILSNLLLVMGMCFFFGGWRRIEQFFNITVAQTAASLLALAVGSLLIPTCFHRFGTGGTDAQREAQIPKLSRGEAVILLIVYISYLYFQLSTHSAMFNETGGAATKRKPSRSDTGSIRNAVSAMGAGAAAHAGMANKQILNENAHAEPPRGDDDDDDSQEPQLSVVGAIATLCIATALIGICSEFMVDGIQIVATKISPEFIGLILIPIVGNAAEHATAVTVAMKDKMDLAIGVAVGSSMQIALFVLPLVVVIGWIIGKDDMTLEFDGFLLTIVFVAVLLVNYLIGDGKSHWLEGVMLMLLYVIVAVAAYLYPADASSVVG